MRGSSPHRCPMPLPFDDASWITSIKRSESDLWVSNHAGMFNTTSDANWPAGLCHISHCATQAALPAPINEFTALGLGPFIQAQEELGMQLGPALLPPSHYPVRRREHLPQVRSLLKPTRSDRKSVV